MDGWSWILIVAPAAGVLVAEAVHRVRQRVGSQRAVEAFTELEEAIDRATRRASAFSIGTITISGATTTTTGGGFITGAAIMAGSYVWRSPEKFGHPLPAEPDEPVYLPYPILGWRVTHFDYNGSSHFRGSYQGNWDMGMHEARCASRRTFGPDSTHDGVPGWDCTCGIYAHNDLGHLVSPGDRRGHHYDNSRLVSLVAMQGVIEHEEGYRSNRAWIVGTAWIQGAPDNGDSRRRQASLLQDLWPVQPLQCRSLVKLERVRNYYDNHPDQIPVPSSQDWMDYHFATWGKEEQTWAD